MRNIEEQHQIAFCTWLKHKHKEVVFTSESSGLKLPVGLAVKTKKMRSPERGFADLLIFRPNSQFHGLFIEFKESEKALQLRNGDMKKNEHNLEQAAFAEKVRNLGYCYFYAFSVDDAIQKFESYLKK